MVIAASRGLFLAVLPLLEDHFEGDPEEQQAAGDAEGADRNAEHAEHAGAEQREDGENEEGDQRAAQRHLLALRCGSCRPSGPRKIGARPGGSMVTSSVVKALISWSALAIVSPELHMNAGVLMRL